MLHRFQESVGVGMQRRLKRVAIGLGVLLVALIGTALAAPSFLDWNRYKPEIANAVREATGRNLLIDGDISLAILPSPRLSVASARLRNIEGGREPDMARLKSLQIHVALGPLLSGRVEIGSITLIEPVLVLETLPDGRNNWDFPTASPVGGSGATSGGASSSVEQARDDSNRVRLDKLTIENGRLAYVDGRANSTEQLAQINAELSAGSLAGPFKAQGSAQARGLPLKFEVSTGRFNQGQPAALSFRLASADGALESRFTGSLKTDDGPQIAGKVTVSAPDLRRLAQSVGTTPPTWPVPGINLEGALSVSPKGAALNEMAVQLGETRATGAVTALFAAPAQLDVALAVSRVDLDKWLASMPAPAMPATSTATAPPTSGGAAAGGFALPRDWRGSLDLAVEAIAWRGGQIRQLRLNTALANGTVTVNQLTLQAPGRTELSALGTLEAVRGQPRFNGSAEIVADNLRGVLEWLRIEPGALPNDRLRRASIKARVTAGPDEIALGALEAQLDSTRVNGTAKLSLGGRPAMAATLTVDRLVLDAYLPASAPPAAAPSGPAAPGVATPASTPAVPRELVTAFDADLDLRAGQLTVRDLSLRELRLDASLRAGKLAVRDLSVGDALGARGKATAVIDLTAKIPSADVAIDMAAREPARLLKAAGAAVPAPIEKLPELTAKGTFKGTLDKLAIDLDLGAWGGTLAVDGTVAADPPGGPFDLALKGRFAEAGPALAALGVIDERQRTGALTLAARAKGTGERIDVDTTVEALGGKAKLAGHVTNREAQPLGLDFKVDADHPDLSALLARLDLYRPADPSLGPLRIDAHLKGSATSLAIEGLDARIGPLELKGSASYAGGGKRPKVVASLQTGAIPLDALLPGDAPSGGAAAAPTGGAQRRSAATPTTPARAGWSRQPIDSSGLRAFDADLKLTASSITLEDYKAEAVDVAARLAGGVLDIQHLRGRTFGGSIEVKGRATAGDSLGADLAIAVRDADLRALAQEKAKLIGGRLSLDADLRTSGRSEYDLVAALGGKASFDVKDGTIKGFDVDSFSDRMISLRSAIDFVQLAQGSLAKGRTSFTDARGNFTIERGVATTRDTRLQSRSAVIDVTGNADLPRRLMDFQAKFKLTQQPSAPPFGVDFKGPFDNPSYTFHTGDLQQHLFRRVDSLIRRVLPSEQPPSGGESSQPSSPPSPGELLRRVLPLR
jgi:uncharacterized protein involved in outer membrane biogenesis